VAVEQAQLLATVHRVEQTHDRLPTTKRFRSRLSSHVSGIPLKDAGFLSSGA
jgi:hypothetical protein